MRLLLCMLLAGCAGSSITTTTQTPTCQNVTDETTVAVPYSWDVKNDTQTTTMADGCTYTLNIHYVLDSGGSVGAGGSAPDPLHCDVDGCSGPPDRIGTYSDPAPMVTNGQMGQ